MRRAAYEHTRSFASRINSFQLPNIEREFLRYGLVAVLFIGVAFAILIQIVHIQLSDDGEIFRQNIQNLETVYHTFYPGRGDIYDKNGHLLAGSRQVYEVAVDLYYVRNAQTIAIVLSNAMRDHVGYDRAEYYFEVLEKASRQPTNETNYLVVADYVTDDELAMIKEIAAGYLYGSESNTSETPPSLSGLVYRPRLQRIYPEKDLASNLLGFTDWDGNGLYGLELSYNGHLAGQPFTRVFSVDPLAADEMPEVEKGGDVILTITREIQAAVEDILDRAVNNSGATAGTIVVMNPQNGEILAMTSSRRMDLNRYYDFPEIINSSLPYNMPFGQTYEPGSVFKVLTMAAALDSGTVTPETTYIDTGYIEIGGIPIYNWNYGAWGEQNMTGCLQHSLNVCMVTLAQKMTPTIFYNYMRNFGIGRTSGMDLYGEPSGRLKLPGDKDWFESDLGTNSFGQGVAVTPIQMLAAISALANDGQMVQPHVVQAYVKGGRQYTTQNTPLGSPIKAETARTLSEMLAISLEEEASDALVEGYRVSGKTGTAQIPTPTGYHPSLTNASFVGWGPTDDPQIMVYIWLQEPTSSPWGSVVAAPVFAEVFQRVAVLTNLPPDSVRIQLNGPTVKLDIPGAAP